MSTLTLLLIIISTIVVRADLQCERAKHVLIGDRCYIFVPKEMNFISAFDHCLNDEASLAVVDSIFVNNYLASLAANEFSSTDGSFWIGLNRSDSDTFQWSNGASPVFTNWVKGFPNSLNYVLERITDGKWKTETYDNQLPFVCYYDAGRTTAVPVTTSLPSTSTESVSTTSSTADFTTTATTTSEALTSTVQLQKTTTGAAITSTTTASSSTVSPSTTSEAKICPGNFSVGPDGYCYGIVEFTGHHPENPIQFDPLSVESQLCASVHGTVASIPSGDVNAFIRQLVFFQFREKGYVTIGLENNGIHGWSWVDGTPYNYENFKHGFPRPGDMIAQIEEDGTWLTYTHTVSKEGVLCRV